MELMIWLGLVILFILIEVLTMGYFTIWFAIGAMVAVAAAALELGSAIQIGAFLVVSIASLILLRPILVKCINRDEARAKVESMIGRQAIVISEIDNHQGGGLVKIGKTEWSAKSKREYVNYSIGDVVRVVAVSGKSLIVR